MSYVLVDRKGNEERLKAEPREYGEFALSPDGTRIAVNVYADPTEVWTYDLERDIWARLTFDPTEEERPIWSPDGRHVAFGPALSWKAVDGTGEIEQLREGSSQQFPNAFSPDGTLLVFEDRKSGDLDLLSLSGERGSTVLLGTEYVERNAALSPDGSFMAYQSNESGRFEIYVRPFPEVSAGRWQVSNDGGGCPFWARDGRELFYVGPQAIMSVGIATEPSFALGRSVPLFATAPYVNVMGATRCSVAGSADGRFLLLKEGGGSEGAAAPQSIVIVQKWFEELKALVPVK